MTFRIERVHLAADADSPSWRLRVWFKGLHGKGEYGNAEYEGGIPKLVIRKEVDGQPLLEVDSFELALPSTPKMVTARIAAVLTELGWGPEVDAYGHRIERHEGSC